MSKSLSPEEKVKAGTLGSSMTRWGAMVGVAALVASLIWAGVVTEDHYKRFLYGFLVAWQFAFTLCLGSLIFVLIHHVTRAKWDTVLLRIAENVATALPIVAAIGFLFIMVPMLVLDNHQLYFWDYWHNLPKDLQHDEAYHHLAKKGAWLSAPFFAGRFIVYMAIYSAIAFYFASNSKKQDETGDPRINEKLRIHAGWCIVAVGLTTYLVGFDLEMSLSPEWYSTIFSVNMFGGAMVGTYAFLSVLTRLIQRGGRLQKAVTVEHYHDMGKMLFGFNMFWAYTAFSPFMLIWYSNIPEEVVWYRYRWVGTDWYYLSIFVILFVWAIPYTLLLSRWSKRILPIFMILCVEQLIAHYIDLYWNIMPNMTWGESEGVVTGPLTGPLAAHQWHFAATDLLSFIGVFALFLAAVGSRMKGNLLPVKNPSLGASLAFENY